jgi:hypothetical protein
MVVVIRKTFQTVSIRTEYRSGKKPRNKNIQVEKIGSKWHAIIITEPTDGTDVTGVHTQLLGGDLNGQ